MSVLSHLCSALTAKELQTPITGSLSGNLTLEDAIPAFNALSVGPILRTMPSRRPWSQAPSHIPTSLTSIDCGDETKMIDMLWVANRYVGLMLSGDFEQMISDDWKKPLSLVAVPVAKLPRIKINATAFEVATRLGDIEENILLVESEDVVTGFITYESLQQSAFTLPLFGLLLQLEEAALQWIELKAQERWEMLSVERRASASLRASEEFLKSAECAREANLRTIPLDTALNAWLSPDETADALADECEAAGAPIKLCLQMTTFIDKGMILRKAGAMPHLSGKELARLWRKAEEIRNCVAHGRAWWVEVKSANDLMTFIGGVHELLRHITTAIQHDVSPA